MSVGRPIREWRTRRAFSLWLAGEAGASLFPPSNEPIIRWLRGLALAEAGEADQSLAQLQLPPAAPAAFLAAAYLWAGRPQETVALCRDVEGNPLMVALLGLGWLEAGEPRLAAKAWRRKGPAPWRLSAARALGALLIEAQRVEPRALEERLIQDLREEPSQRPWWPARAFRKGLDLLQGLGPRLRSKRAALGRIQVLSLAARGDLTAAIALAGSLRKEFRQESWPRALLVDLLARKGEDRRILELGAGVPALAGAVGLAQARLGKWRDARDTLARLDRPEAVQLFAIGAALALEGRANEATHALLRLGAKDEPALLDLLERETKLLLLRDDTA